MRKLIVLPGYCTSLGGMTVSLSSMVKGFERCGASEQVRVLVQSGTLLEEYLRQAGLGFCLQLLDAQTPTQFAQLSLQRAAAHPSALRC